MWSPFADSPPRSVAPAATSSGHQSERFGGTWIPTSGISSRAWAMSRFMSSIDTGQAHSGQVAGRPMADAGAPVVAGGGVGDLGRLAPVVALVGHEVLEDDLLDVAVLALQLSERRKRGHALLLGLTDPDEDPARERDPQLAGGADRLQTPERVLRRRAGMDGLHQPLGDGFEHQALRRGHLAQASEVLARQHAEVGVRKQPALERALARPHDVPGEVGVAVLGQPLGDRGVDLGTLAGEHEQLLGAVAHGAVEDREHLLGGVQVRLVRGERAVLAIAPARPRQRQREVPRERHPAAHARQCMTGGEPRRRIIRGHVRRRPRLPRPARSDRLQPRAPLPGPAAGAARRDRPRAGRPSSPSGRRRTRS